MPDESYDCRELLKTGTSAPLGAVAPPTLRYREGCGVPVLGRALEPGPNVGRRRPPLA